MRQLGSQTVFVQHGQGVRLANPDRAFARGGLTAEQIGGHPALPATLRQQAGLMLQAYEANPRISSVFATQQRWLMGQAALALAFRARASGQGGISSARFFDLVGHYKVASRNTADAFLKEMLKYNYVRQVADAPDRRTRPLEPTETSIDAIQGWVAIHLSTLDRLDGGRRLEIFLGTPGAVADLQPRIADGLLCSRSVREPERMFSLFTWLDNGGVVMEWLIATPAENAVDAERAPVGMVSIADLADWLKLSRTHLARKLREAEEMGCIGWLGKRGHSEMWVSAGFRQEYARAQAVKLAIVETAFEARFGRAAAAKKHPEIVGTREALQIDRGVSLT